MRITGKIFFESNGDAREAALLNLVEHTCGPSGKGCKINAKWVPKTHEQSIRTYPGELLVWGIAGNS